MRALADAARIRQFMSELARAADRDARVYFTGGATAVLFGWRSTTIDVDIKITPESNRLLQAIPRLKEALQINVELAAPDQFIPPLPGWEGRSPLVTREGMIAYHHYDLYAQALAKLERSHQQDVEDVRQMWRRDLIQPGRLAGYYEDIEPQLYHYPAVDPAAFRRAVTEFLRSPG